MTDRNSKHEWPLPGEQPALEAALYRTGRALDHPLRVRIVLVMGSGEEMTPTDISSAIGESLGTASHHIRVLAMLGVLCLTRKVPVRGAFRHFYVLSSEQRVLLPSPQQFAEVTALSPAPSDPEGPARVDQ
jgi:DNA-binding transcriptional ArsR family regulator